MTDIFDDKDSTISIEEELKSSYMDYAMSVIVGRALPDAREDESSPIYGMPVIEVDRAKTVFVLKRSMASGFAGIENSLFFKQNTRMLFGDAKESVSGLVSEFKS